MLSSRKLVEMTVYLTYIYRLYTARIQLHLRSTVAAFDHLDDGPAEIGRTERVHERVQPGVDVGHPERRRVEVFGHYVRVGQTHVEDEVEWDPADHVGDDDVGQSDEGFPTFVCSLVVEFLFVLRRLLLRLLVCVIFLRWSRFGVFALGTYVYHGCKSTDLTA